MDKKYFEIRTRETVIRTYRVCGENQSDAINNFTKGLEQVYFNDETVEDYSVIDCEEDE